MIHKWNDDHEETDLVVICSDCGLKAYVKEGVYDEEGEMVNIIAVGKNSHFVMEYPKGYINHQKKVLEETKEHLDHMINCDEYMVNQMMNE